MRVCRHFGILGLLTTENIAKHSILVVDDEAAIVDLLSVYLRKQGYAVTTAISSAEAKALIDERSFGLVILDILLAESDGLVLLGQLKETHPDLPVVMMTGLGFDERLLREAMSKGASAYVSKTLPLDQLLKEIRQVLPQ